MVDGLVFQWFFGCFSMVELMDDYTMTTMVKGPEAKIFTEFARSFVAVGEVPEVKVIVPYTFQPLITEKVNATFKSTEKVKPITVNSTQKTATVIVAPKLPCTVGSTAKQQQPPQPQPQRQQPQKTLKQQLEANTQVPINPTPTYHPTTNEVANLRIDAKMNLDKILPKLTTNQLIQLANFARILSTNFLENNNQQSFQLPNAPALPLDRQNEILLSNMPSSSYPCRCRICNARLDNPLAWLSHMDNHTAFEPPAKRPK